jgi:hypothetical protein
MVTTPFELTRETEAQVEQLLQRGELNLALGAIAASADALMRRDELIGHTLLLPQYDQYLCEISEAVAARVLREPLHPGTGCTLVVASETYSTGGHSRVVEDLCRHVDKPAIVLTDLFNRINSDGLGVAHLYRQAGDASVSLLPKGSLLDKTINLLRLVATLQPRQILILGHHQDVIPYAALASRQIKVPRSFIHHTDHHPALGCTIDAFQHVDLTHHVGAYCSEALHRPVGYLPLHVADQGSKAHEVHELADTSVVTSGNSHKYCREGAHAYRQIVLLSSLTVGGRFHHIGALPDDWVAEIRAHLQANGVDPTRFVHHGPVPSLWQALKGINADVYLTSAPVGGGRAAIEAQGCGYPVVYFQNPVASQRPLFVTEMFHAQAPKWSSLDQLPQALLTVAADSQAHALASRAFYERHFSEASFHAALSDVLRRGEVLAA